MENTNKQSCLEKKAIQIRQEMMKRNHFLKNNYEYSKENLIDKEYDIPNEYPL